MAARPFLFALVSSTALITALTPHTPALAQAGSREAQIVVDAQTNEILYENNAQASRRPASITKVMTLYLLFDALKRGNLTWDDQITFSRNAASQPPTKLFVGAGNSIPVQTAVEALILRSANDVATAVAEKIGGSETNFATMMTRKARELGMANTTFRNASGLPNATQRSTAEDLARLAIAIHRDFPDQYHWFAVQEMSWNGQRITGHNHLLGKVPGMDGLKTGYTDASGFNLAATTQRNGRRVVTIVLGGATRFQRDDLVEALTESAFTELGIGSTQFTSISTSYQAILADSRDAGDAAALIMDLPSLSVTPTGRATFAISRSGRYIRFDQVAAPVMTARLTGGAPHVSAVHDDAHLNEKSSPQIMFAATEKASSRLAPVSSLAMTEGEVAAEVKDQAQPPSEAVPTRQMAMLEARAPAVATIVSPKTDISVADSDAAIPGSVTNNVQEKASNTDLVANAAMASQPSSAAASPPSTDPLAELTPAPQTSEIASNPMSTDSTSNPNVPSDASEAAAEEDTETKAEVASSPTDAQTQKPQTTDPAPVLMAEIDADAVAQAQRRQAEANAREAARLTAALELEEAQREAARTQAATAARLLAEARGERQQVELRSKLLKERRERALAAREEVRRQAEVTRARQARGTAIVQVGAFKDKAAATAAISKFASLFPSFAKHEVSSVSRRDGVWYRARFGGLGDVAAREACRLVLGRGGACQIVGE
jgi:D-alanyl-D-alanine carboxypeptidase